MNPALLGGPGLILLGLAVIVAAYNGRPLRTQSTRVVVGLVAGPILVALSLATVLIGGM